MTLLIDVGNSAIKWATLANDGSLSAAHIQLHRGVSALATLLADQWRGPLTPGAAVVDAMAGPTSRPSRRGSANASITAVRWFARSNRSIGVDLPSQRLQRSSATRCDRWHRCWARARHRRAAHANSFVVVNAGTATTVDCVEVAKAGAGEARFSGKFIGGLIAPGMRLMLESLARQTARLPAADADRADNAADFPDNTDAAIVSGVLDAQAGLIERICHRFAARLQTEPRLVLTGGYAQALSARLSRAANIEHNLVLRGLALRAQSDLSKVS